MESLELVKIVTMLNVDHSQLPLFQGFTPEQLRKVEVILKICHFAKGEKIFKQNQFANHLYILVKGEVEIQHHPYDGPAITVSKILPGGVFGWSAALGRDVYTSSATTLEECETYRISHAALHNFCEHHHKTGVVLLERMTLSVTQRPKQSQDQLFGVISKAMDCREK